MREALEDKVDRLLITRCVRVVGPGAAIVIGDHDTYPLAFDGLDWQCTCPGYAYRRTCSHSQAVGRVTVIPELVPA